MGLRKTEKYGLFSIDEIASWQLGEKVKRFSGENIIRAGVPTLQRSAVWTPQQIEFLWDSLLRGFPIGSLLLCNKIEGQRDQKTVVGTKETDNSTTHHILDGQQRCNAIALGFFLPEAPRWSENEKRFQRHRENSDGNMLWLDLKPANKSDRKYLFRVTTFSHPWGYRNDIWSGRLDTGSINHFRKIYDEVCKDDKGYPLVCASVPYMAEMPIPMGLLMCHINSKAKGKELICWDELLKNKWISFIDAWLKKKNKENSPEKSLSNFLNDKEKRGDIEGWIKMLIDTRVPFMEFSSENPIDDVAMIFARINNQGTPINQEELRYSMIKAYYPGVEQYIRELYENGKLPANEARVVSLAMQAALILEKGKIVNSGSISDANIRQWFSDKGSEESRIINSYIEKDLGEAINWIENNLVYDKEGKNELGVPPYLRSSIAWRSPDVYLWWLLLAKGFEYKPIQEKKKRILAISTVIHWFGYKKNKLVESLPISVSDDDELRLDFSDTNNMMKAYLFDPEGLKDRLTKYLKMAFEIEISRKEGGKNKNVISGPWGLFEAVNKEGEAKEKDNDYFKLLNSIWNQRELLVYAQRQYLSKYDYDPSNRRLWQTHNRPWDYDHILPSREFDGTGRDKRNFVKGYYVGKFMQNSIGNQMALSFHENRSKQDDSVDLEKNEILQNAFYFNSKPDAQKIREDMENFGYKKFYSVSDNDEKKKFEECKEFSVRAAERLVGIYREWYDKLDVGRSIKKQIAD